MCTYIYSYLYINLYVFIYIYIRLQYFIHKFYVIWNKETKK